MFYCIFSLNNLYLFIQQIHVIYCIVRSHNVSIDSAAMYLPNTHLLVIYFSIHSYAFKHAFKLSWA